MNIRINYLSLGLVEFEVLKLVLGTLLQRNFRPDGEICYSPSVHILRGNGEYSVRLLKQSRVCRDANTKVKEEVAVIPDHSSECSPQIEVIGPQCACRGSIKCLKFAKSLHSVSEIKGNVIVEMGNRRIVGIHTEMQISGIVTVRSLHISGVQSAISEIEIKVSPLQICPAQDARTGIHIIALPGLISLREVLPVK